MAWYRDAAFIEASDGAKSWWERDFLPAAQAPVAGIYRCIGCSREIAIGRAGRFPPGNDHRHEPGARAIAWRLIVRANASGHPTAPASGGHKRDGGQKESSLEPI